MKVLVAIANYGTNNDHFLARLLAEYRAMPDDVHVAILTNLPKDLGPDVEVIVGLPDEKNPWSLPFAHRKLFGERRNDYDLYIYSEDDTLLRHKNIEAFLQATRILPSNALAGFLRSETDPQGNVYYSTVHNHFHWDASSVLRVGDFTFAHFTNEHAASFLLTREQLNRAISSGGFLVPPHQGRYGILEAAATDPYTQCGFRKMTCVSHLDDFTLPHLPNKYIGKLGLPKNDFDLQLEALRKGTNGKPPCATPLANETNLPEGHWSKSYYEAASKDLLSLMPVHASNVLSVGCGWGALEGELISRGVRVAGVPLDGVIAPCAAARGVEIIAGTDPFNFRNVLSGDFDGVLLSNILHLVPDPAAYLQSVSRALKAGGCIVIRVPHVGGWPLWKKKWKGNGMYSGVDDFNKSGVHRTSAAILRKWMRLAELQVADFRTVIHQRVTTASKFVLGLADDFLSEDFLVVGRK